MPPVQINILPFPQYLQIRVLSHSNQWRDLDWILSYHRALFPVESEKKGDRLKHVENNSSFLTARQITESLNLYDKLCLSISTKSTPSNHFGKFWKNSQMAYYWTYKTTKLQELLLCVIIPYTSENSDFYFSSLYI